MNFRLPSSLVPRLTAGGLVVLVIILAFAFVAGVLIPGLELAGELADSTVALKFVGQQQRNPALIHASLDSMHDRLTNRGYIQESLDQMRDATGKLDAGLREMNAPTAASWFSMTGSSYSMGDGAAPAGGEPFPGKQPRGAAD